MRRMASKAVAALLVTLTGLGASHLQGCTIAAALRGVGGSEFRGFRLGAVEAATQLDELALDFLVDVPVVTQLHSLGRYQKRF